MKTNLVSSAVRLTTVALALTFIAAASAADRASELLASQGSVPVKNAGPYVQSGTFQIQVSTKLGQPSAKLANGAWLYQNYAVENSDAHGTLVVQFTQGRVSQLALVTPANAFAMMNAKPAPDRVFVAQRN